MTKPRCLVWPGFYAMSTLVINAGSCSLKFGVFATGSDEPLVTGEIDWASGDRQQATLVVRPRNGTTVHSAAPVHDNFTAAACAIQAALGSLGTGSNASPAITEVGHRIAYGGAGFCASVLIDERVKTALSRLSEAAPLHNPLALNAIEAAEAAIPEKPEVAVFDTAFFAGLPPHAFLYPVPYDWYENWGIRRFGFHGISHSYCAGRAAELMRCEVSRLRVITCHLGSGCSAAAVEGGIAIATTGGFSPLDGLMMGTRCGAIDPGIVIDLQRQNGLSCKELYRALNHGSGLLGISGVSADLAQIEVAAAQGNKRASLAFEMFAAQLRSAVASLAATLGGVDVLTFTDRVGEGSESLRAAACEGLQFMGIRLDPQRNAHARADADIAADDSPARVFVIHADVQLMIAREARRVVAQCH